VTGRATRWMLRSWQDMHGLIPISFGRSPIVAQQEALTLIRARALLVRLRTAAVNAVHGLTKSCGYRMPVSATTCFAQRSVAVMPPGLGPGAPTDRGNDHHTSELLIESRFVGRNPSWRSQMLITGLSAHWLRSETGLREAGLKRSVTLETPDALSSVLTWIPS
jgi:hypothetical protein